MVQPRHVATMRQAPPNGGTPFLVSRAPMPTYLLRCQSPVLFPIPMREGELLLITPEHPTHTMAVLTPDGSQVVRYGYGEDTAERRAQFTALCDDGALVWLLPPVELPLPAPRARAS